MWMRILLVEDEPHAAKMLAKGLREQTYAVDVALDGRKVLELVSISDYDAVILDVMLPFVDGLEVCQRLRAMGSQVPVLMLTARDSIDARIAGLDSGADDYLTKPFGIRELLARVRALLRRGEVSQARAAAGASTGPISYKHIEVDPARRRVRVGNRDVGLTFNEFELLYVLISNPGIVFSRESLLSKVWKDQTFVTVRSVDTLVKRLRKKIESQPADPDVILTVWGAGYKAADV
jgi:two-component system, OmpR family, response regulator